MIQRNVTWNIHGNVGNEIFKWNITNTTTIATYVGKNFWCNIRIIIFQFLIVIQTAVYIAERFVIQWNFSDLKNLRFIIESGFKSRAGYNGARTVYYWDVLLYDFNLMVQIFREIRMHIQKRFEHIVTCQ